MKTIAIITLVAAAEVVYMMSPFETSALENLFRSIMIEYKKSYNSKAEYKFKMEVLRMNLESPNIPWSIPNSVVVFRLQLTKFSELCTITKITVLNYAAGYYCLAGTTTATQYKRLRLETEGNIFIFIIRIINFICSQYS